MKQLQLTKQQFNPLTKTNKTKYQGNKNNR